jgi:hypothetical protein
MNNIVTEDAKRTWDVWLGIGAPILTILGIVIGVYQFNTGEENRARLEHELIKEKDNVDFHRKLWSEQVTAYRSVAELAGKIAAGGANDKMKELVRDFLGAYWGTMILVEDKSVEKAMINFYIETRDLQEGWSDESRLKVRADELIDAFRKSEEQPPTW